MVKSIIKEVLIILLLIIAILLILGILFYDYYPATKKIPTGVEEYTLPKDMQAELDETIKTSEQQNIIKTYRVNADDLKIYQRRNDYQSGKINPFSREATQNPSTGNNSTSQGNNTSSGNQTSQGNSGGSFLNTIK